MAQVSGVATVTVTRGSTIFNLASAADVVPLFIESTDIDLSEPSLRKGIEAVVFDMTNQSRQSGLMLTIKGRNNLSDALETHPAVSVGVSGPVFVRPPAWRYIRFRLDDVVVSERYTIGRITFYGYRAGRRY